MRIGIAGIGVIGGALSRWLAKHGHDVVEHDPPKKIIGDFTGCDAVFICVPAPTLLASGPIQDLSAVKSAITHIPLRLPIYIRSTVLPGTCDKLALEFERPIVSVPEFLTARRADADMEKLGIIAGGLSFTAAAAPLQDIFADKRILISRNAEVELAKYMHNVLLALEVLGANIVKIVADRCGANYSTVAHLAKITGFIDGSHTQVPGPDRERGFGGSCFPKDLEAFAAHVSEFGGPASDWLWGAGELNRSIRKNGQIPDSALAHPGAPNA